MEGHPAIVRILLRISVLAHSFPLGNICFWVVWLWTLASYRIQCKDVSYWCLLRRKIKRKVCLVNSAVLWGFLLSSMQSGKTNFPSISYNLMCVFWVLWSSSDARGSNHTKRSDLGRVRSLSNVTFSGVCFVFSCRHVWVEDCKLLGQIPFDCRGLSDLFFSSVQMHLFPCTGRGLLLFKLRWIRCVCNSNLKT